MSSIKFFISYAHVDQVIASEIQEECLNQRIECFLDAKKMSWGDSVTDGIGRGLVGCSHLLLILSPASEKSNWVFFEVGRATERGMTILPYLTHEAIEPPGFFKRHTPNYENG
jgi:hypothetical protein